MWLVTFYILSINGFKIPVWIWIFTWIIEILALIGAFAKNN